jgi:cytochrome d ubiquinol oxidase subunit I
MDNTAVILARLQFGITLTYHFWFVALTLGLSVLVAVMETLYVFKNKAVYREMAKFWGSLFLVNYVVGVVSGIVQEFQFGMNWSEYSRFVGGVLGVPLAFEALTAFCVEATFIGIWVYGRNVVPRSIHLLSIWLVALASNYSAYWILAANAFMQQPVGYRLEEGYLALVQIKSILLNPYLFYQYIHTVMASFASSGLFVMAVSAFYLLSQQHHKLAVKSFKLGLICAWMAGILTFASGHLYTQYLVKAQPMKVAAMEALWESAESAPFIVVALIDEEQQRNKAEISLTGMLSVLAANHSQARIAGMKEVQEQFAALHGAGNYIPPVLLLFWSFRFKVAVGLLIILVTSLSLWYFKKHQLQVQRLLLYGVIWTLPLVYLSHLAGWLISEVGRQPWLVYGLQLTEQGISRNVPVSHLWITLISFNGIYAIMAGAAIFFMRRRILIGPEQPGD